MSLGVRLAGQPFDLDLVTGLSGAEIIVGATQFNPAINTKKSRLAIRYSTSPTFANSTYVYGGWKAAGYSCTSTYPAYCTAMHLHGLLPDTKYYIKVFIDYEPGGNESVQVGSFYTARRPLAPELLLPDDFEDFDGIEDINFSWNFLNPDSVLGGAYVAQHAYELRYRTTGTPVDPAGDWTTVDATTATEAVTVSSSLMAANTQYEWQVRTQNGRLYWGPWSDARTFTVGGGTTPPLLLDPIGDQSFLADEDHRFRWLFRNPPGDTNTQAQADLRYREVGSPTWTTLTGAGSVPGTDEFWDFPAGTFATGHYEWQARTTNDAAVTTDWSPSSVFWVVAVGQDSGGVTPELSENQAALGVGQNRAYIYERGGKIRLGEVKSLQRLQWNRKRDDISNALITTTDVGDDSEGGAQLLRGLRTWRHELVIFRDGVRVWEGPIVRIGWSTGAVEIEAWDVMAYVYRRIMRQGYNDAYRRVGWKYSSTGKVLIKGLEYGLTPVPIRARKIIMNALGYDDPNVLPYLTVISNSDDAKCSRIVAGYTKSAWAEVDDLAANAGLDYTTVGRRIILNDTHRAIGRLSEMTDGDFSEPPVVTEYGMQAANEFAVTNNAGVYGSATRIETVSGVRQTPPEGYVEQIASSYGESAGETTATLTAAAKAKLVATLNGQAERNIAPRWPPPVIVRIPDNATLQPELNIGINQLVPGVWIPLRAAGTLRIVTQLQKLDSMQVSQEEDAAEKITVIMGAAPKAGLDEIDTEGGE